MASSGKKGKKKGTVISLQSFLSNGEEAPMGMSQVAKKIRNVDGDDSDDGSNAMPLVLQLPTAPRASRIFDDDSVPHKPPFIAYITNLPFDINEDDIYGFFASTPITALRLPREDGDTGRVRGFGYIELETRDDLLHVLSLPDPSIKGRRIRIELSNEQEQQNQRQRNRRGFDGFGNSHENRDSTDWRRGSNNDEQGQQRSNNYDRGFNRDRKPTAQREEENNTPGSWRMGNRVPVLNADVAERRRDYNNSEKRREERIVEKETTSQERPKLNLKPRTLPLPDVVVKSLDEGSKPDAKQSTASAGGVAAEKVFGSAKPVDTAAREKEIEERMAESRKQQSIQREAEEVTYKLANVHLEKTDKENANNILSWRRKKVDGRENSSNNHSPERSMTIRIDDHNRRRDNTERDYNNRYNKHHDKVDRSEYSRNKSNQYKEDKPREENRKRDNKTERPLPKIQPNPAAPILQTLNKYSGLDDDASE